MLGLDLSVLSTGIYSSKQDHLYWIIGKELSDKQKKKLGGIQKGELTICVDPANTCTTIYYPKMELDKKSTSYTTQENIKFNNVSWVIESLTYVINVLGGIETQCAIEGISFNSPGDTSALSGLNYMVRDLVSKNGISFSIISPQTLKTRGVPKLPGKTGLLEQFKTETTQCKEFVLGVTKKDDLIDAYYLSTFEEE